MCSLLSTAVGPEHEPPLPRGEVSLWKTKSGTQCGAYGQWTGPFIYHCDADLLHDITSHPAIEQHHLLAYVSRPAADTKGHTEIDFFWQKNGSKHTTFSKWPTGQQQAVHDPITHFTSANYQVLEDCPNTIVGCHDPQYNNPFHSLGEYWTQKNSPGQKGKNHSHPEMVWLPNQRGDPRIQSCWQEESVQWTFYSARGTELL